MDSLQKKNRFLALSQSLLKTSTSVFLFLYRTTTTLAKKSVPALKWSAQELKVLVSYIEQSAKK